MVIADENNGILWGNSLADQLTNNNTEWDYPSYDQNRVDTGNPVTLSDVVQAAEAAQIADQNQMPWAQPNEWSYVDQQGIWPMKITEEALESMKAQELAAQAAAIEQPVDNQFWDWTVWMDNPYDMNNSSMEQQENPMDEWNSLWTFSFWEEKIKVKRYNTWFVISLLWCIIFWVLTYFTYLFYEYLEYKSLPTVPSDKVETVNNVSDKYDDYGQRLWLFDLETYKVIYLENELSKVDDLLNDPNLNFIQKKDDLQRSLLRFWNEIINLKNTTRGLREKMNREWFFPQELVWILDAENAIDSIQRSLISLEVVKFSSAIRVFSLLDDIVKELADNFDYTKTNIKERLDELIERWEEDVEYYLNVCYNNPYEPPECNNINDFDAYYKTIKEEESFDTEFFKDLMKYINNQIEYNDLPSFSILFNNFDWRSNSMTFTVEVNTTLEDQKALVQQGIKSPHIYIISELIKLLKQSTFIVWKGIDARNIKVNPKVVTVAWKQFNVQNSSNSFTLPIQKTTEREIFDFIETYSSNLQSTWFEEFYEEDIPIEDELLDEIEIIEGDDWEISEEWMTDESMDEEKISSEDEGISENDTMEEPENVDNWESTDEIVYNWEVQEESAWFITDEEMTD